MTDREIVSQFLKRDEEAVENARRQYSTYCKSIARSILQQEDDAEECLNDVWLAAWNSIPPHEPERLGAYLGKLTRNIAIDRVRTDHAAKRCTGEYDLSLEELAEILPDVRTTESEVRQRELRRLLAEYVRGLPPIQRRVFVCRYWYFDSVADIAERFGFSESKVKSMLHRLRGKLKQTINREDYV